MRGTKPSMVYRIRLADKNQIAPHLARTLTHIAAKSIILHYFSLLFCFYAICDITGYDANKITKEKLYQSALNLYQH